MLLRRRQAAVQHHKRLVADSCGGLAAHRGNGLEEMVPEGAELGAPLAPCQITALARRQCAGLRSKRSADCAEPCLWPLCESRAEIASLRRRGSVRTDAAFHQARKHCWRCTCQAILYCRIHVAQLQPAECCDRLTLHRESWGEQGASPERRCNRLPRRVRPRRKKNLPDGPRTPAPDADARSGASLRQTPADRRPY